jgi:hypothetical protein
LFDAGDQSERFGSFDIKDANDLLGLFVLISFAIDRVFEVGSFKGIKDWGGELSVRCAVDGCRLFATLDTTGQQYHC